MRNWKSLSIPALLLVVTGLLVGVLSGALGGPARAQTLSGAGPWFDTDQGSVRLISAVDSVGTGQALKLGLQFQLEPGWKIYWRSPGDAGFPPRPDWQESRNVAATEISWPAPKRFTIFDVETLGYSDQIVLPLSLTPEVPGQPVRLAGTVTYLTCEEVCIPHDAALSIELPAGPSAVTPSAYLIDRYRAAVPVKQSGSARDVPGGLAVQSASVGPGPQDGFTLTVAAGSTVPFDDGQMELLVEGPAGTWFNKADVSIADDPGRAQFTVTGGGADPAALRTHALTFTLIDGARAVEASLRPGTASPGPGLSPGSGAVGGLDQTFWTIIGFALLGGLILNLMPCVLPVLSLKLMGVVAKSGDARGQVRLGFLASSAGIILSFMLLAGAAIGVKAAGLSVGWGIQFQQPVFLAFMIALLVLFTCNLLGLFDFRLPGSLGDRAAGAAGRSGYFGDFLTGAFATLLATPCSAPFLGTAVGFALSHGPFEILAVFTALGLGLAAPYLAVALFPQAIALMPKPGPWMAWLKRILALALLGTALWLLSVLQVTIGTQSTVAVGLLAGLAAVVLGAKKVQERRLARFAWPLSAMLAALTVVYPLLANQGSAGPIAAGSSGGGEDTSSAQQIEWVAFDPSAIADHVADGRSVFVDVTADWCVTCQWNKKTVMEQGSVAAWIGKADVVAMRADWTRPDKAIADYLASYGRYGIPFNIIYGPEAPGGIVLPELLRAEAVLDAATEAGGKPSLAQR
jgi:suppressor for copper-sensitivity B